MATLIFKNKHLVGLLDLTLKATAFRATSSEMIKAYEEDTGKKYDFNSEIDLEQYSKHNRPTLWLVKDNGIYLMSPAVMKEVPRDRSHICYAEEFRPDDPDSWDKCREAVGGDDFVESLPFNKDLQQAIKRGADIHINITPETISLILVYSPER